MMRLTFCGAAQCVTGSCYLLQLGKRQVLVDCGMEQGEDERDNRRFPFSPREIDCVILTHGHIDHCGRLPVLVRQGFRGSIITTGLTRDLLEVLLLDSASIQVSDTAWHNKRRRRAGKPLEEPLFTEENARQTLTQIDSYGYGKTFEVVKGLTGRFVDAGHILGSAMVELWWQEDGQERKLVFSGDIGNHEMPIICNPTMLTQADYVVMESTCGDRIHEEQGDYQEQLAAIIEDTLRQGGNVLIPAAAVGRSQEVLYCLHSIKLQKQVPSMPDFPVYVDSSLAEKMLRIYDGNLAGYLDDEAMEIVHRAGTVLDFPQLYTSITPEDSKLLNALDEPKIIIAAGSMCEAGRIRHHLKHNLWREECTVVLLGPQRRGTLGRMLLDGAQEVKLFGEEIAVKAKIIALPVRSSHSDRQELEQWIDHFQPKPRQVFVTHGDQETAIAFAQRLTEKGYRATAPALLEQQELD